MEWDLPEPLDIRPCQKPFEFKARQLNLYPLRFKKLPQWVDNASFETETKQAEQTWPLVNAAKQVQSDTQIHASLWSKYKNKEKFVLVYGKGEQKYVFNPNFCYEYISNDYSQLNEWDLTEPNSKIQSIEDNRSSTEIGFQEKNREQIIFQSKFQCGNLSKVYHAIQTNEYHLIMQNDINTLGYNQWYCFSIQNTTHEQQTVDLKIINFAKQSSLYKKGMKPWYITEGSCYWKQIVGNCVYKKTNVKNPEGDYYSELNFSIGLRPGLTFVSMMPIYSYTRLCSKIQKWISIKNMRLYPRKVYTLINNIVPILEYIPHNIQYDLNEEQVRWYDTIVVFARTHPGQVWSSFLMEEFIETIVHYHKSNSVKFRYLIVPMVNPDGVIYGNFRCDFSGVDLNRVWLDPSRFTQPSIYHIKKILAKEFEKKKAKYFIDLHSHSKCLNVFAYTSAQTLLESRLVSDLIRLSDENKIFDPVKTTNSLTKEFLIDSQTTFISSREIFNSKKKSTARAFMSKITQKGKSMTVEISFYGYENKKSSQNQTKAFSVRDFNDFSWCLLKKLHDFVNLKEEAVLAKKILQTIYSFYDYGNQGNITIQSSSKKQTKGVEQAYELSQDSDSEPERYYTAETKKTIKSKNGQLHDFKLASNSIINNKGYLKQTQSLIQRLQVLKKDKSNVGLSNEHKKNKLSQSKCQHLSLPFKRQQRTKKPSFTDSISKSHCDLPITDTLKSEQKTSVNEKSQIKLQSSCFMGEKVNYLRKKLIVQSKKKQLQIVIQKKSQGLIQKNFCPAIRNEISSIVEPMVIQIDEDKKYEPTFGKFMANNKRNSSRRYKTMVRDETSLYKNQASRMRTNNMKEAWKSNVKFENEITPFLQEKFEIIRSHIDKSQKILPEPSERQLSKLNNESQLSQLTKKGQQQTVRKSEQILRKKSKKGTCLDKIHNYKNKYLIQRKKIIEMMKKQTRFCNDIEKQTVSVEQIEEIVKKRKRAKTQSDSAKDHFQDKNIFYESKVNSIKNPQTIKTLKFNESNNSAKKEINKKYQ